ncbi:MAG: phage terminase large subunit [Thaumarchaeota archaeon]|nr:phage terminase large subunit [Nitrososphaerota archaeon]
MNVLVPDYKASAKQAIFHSSPTFETFFAGAAGPGKTAALCAEAITSALEQPSTNVYIFRRTIVELRLSVHAEIQKQLAAYNNSTKQPITFNGQSNRWTFPNGSFIQYAYCQYDGDVYMYQSAEIHVLLIDELTHLKQEWYEYLKTRVRGTGRRLRIMAASNPGNIGHGWCKKYFVDLGDQQIYKGEHGRTRQYIKALIDDHPNPEFRAQYIQTLESIPNERLKKALRWGDWDAFEGQVFMEWDGRVDADGSHVISKLPEGVLQTSIKYIGYDVGRRDPGAAIWVLRAPENQYGVRHYYAYRELYQQWKDARMWAEDIKSYTDEEPVEYLVLPHDAFSIGHGASRSLADTFADYDLPYVRANSLSKGARMHRQDLLHQLLQISPDGTPYLQVHKNCANLIRTIPDLPYSETIREQIDEKAEDHAYDALTYVLMVIDDPESWIVEPQRKDLEFQKTLVYGTPEGETASEGLDIQKILQEKDQRDWRSI